MGSMGSGGAVERNNVVLRGRADGPVVMLAHGFGCDQNLWRLVAPGLERDFRVVLFDHVGAGHSDLSAWDPQRYATLDGYATTYCGSAASWTCGRSCWSGIRSAP